MWLPLFSLRRGRRMVTRKLHSLYSVPFLILPWTFRSYWNAEIPYVKLGEIFSSGTDVLFPWSLHHWSYIWSPNNVTLKLITIIICFALACMKQVGQEMFWMIRPYMPLGDLRKEWNSRCKMQHNQCASSNSVLVAVISFSIVCNGPVIREGWEESECYRGKARIPTGVEMHARWSRSASFHSLSFDIQYQKGKESHW